VATEENPAVFDIYPRDAVELEQGFNILNSLAGYNVIADETAKHLAKLLNYQ
jgi:hypothetical protein